MTELCYRIASVCSFRRNTTCSLDEIRVSEALCDFTRTALHLSLPAEIAALIASLARRTLDWNRVLSHESFEILPESPSVLRLKTERKWHVAIAHAVFESGFKYLCSIRVISLCTPHTQYVKRLSSSFGVVPLSADVSSSTHLMVSWPQVGGWEWWSSHGSARHQLFSTDYGSGGAATDAIVTICVDFSEETMSSTGKGSISFSCNNIDYGIAFADVVPPVNPAVSLYSKGSSVEIISVLRI